MGIVFVHPNYDADLSTVPNYDITEETNSPGARPPPISCPPSIYPSPTLYA